MQNFARMGIFVLAVCLGCGVATGCGDDDGAADNNNVNQNNNNNNVGESVTFEARAWSSADGAYMPAAGVIVAFDAPGGGRTEFMTSATGRVTITDIDWTDGDGAVTFFLIGHRMMSVVNLNPDLLSAWGAEGGAYVMELASMTPDEPEMVTISGDATGYQDPDHYVSIYAVNIPFRPSVFGGTVDETFTVAVPLNETFVLQALEYEVSETPPPNGYDTPVVGALQMDLGPLTADASDVVLDFAANPVSFYTADVQMLLPAQTDSPLLAGSYPWCEVGMPAPYGPHGGSTYAEYVNGNSAIDFTLTWTAEAWAVEFYWTCWVTAPTGEKSIRTVSGVPQQGATEQLPDSPRWVTPADPDADNALHDPLEWTWYDSFDEVAIAIVREGGVTQWEVMAGPNATTATIPAAPSLVNESVMLGSAPYIYVFGGNRGTHGDWDEYARGRAANVVP